ncbi:hypothetical protein BJV78DRAFT_695345 [Lactifluus subvellereus]|nr:hypothetical protein BJV78DRAFT_695345 [Lactifluus subvellereus]
MYSSWVPPTKLDHAYNPISYITTSPSPSSTLTEIMASRPAYDSNNERRTDTSVLLYQPDRTSVSRYHPHSAVYPPSLLCAIFPLRSVSLVCSVRTILGLHRLRFIPSHPRRSLPLFSSLQSLPNTDVRIISVLGTHHVRFLLPSVFYDTTILTDLMYFSLSWQGQCYSSMSPSQFLPPLWRAVAPPSRRRVHAAVCTTFP